MTGGTINSATGDFSFIQRRKRGLSMLYLNPTNSEKLLKSKEEYENHLRAIQIIQTLKGLTPRRAKEILLLATELQSDFFVIGDRSIGQFNVTAEGTGARYEKVSGEM